MAFSKRDQGIVVLLAGALAGLVFLAYLPVLNAQFVNFDDPAYVTDNPHVREGLTWGGIAWAFTTFHSYNWHPVTWLSHMLDVELFGLSPEGHHLTSLLLHVANSILLYVFLWRATGAGWKSVSVAALFALHPLHVESVAWVAERKDVLSTFFGFSALLAYARYARTGKIGAYGLCLLFFVLSLLAKPMLVTLPFVLLLLDYWPLDRPRPVASSAVRRDVATAGALLPLVWEKIPFFAVSLGSSVITYVAQKGGGALLAHNSPAFNAANAFVSYLLYAGKMLWPVRLAIFYPLFPPDTAFWWQAAVAVILLALVSAAVLSGRKRAPYCAVGWLWYVGTLVPVIGFVKVGRHAIADRYTYVPLVGLFLLAVWGAEELGRRRPVRIGLAAATVALLSAFGVLTFRQASTWHDSIALFSHAVAVTDNNWMAHKNLADALADEGRVPEAVLHVSETLRVMPNPADFVDLGRLQLDLGQFAKAAQACRSALALAPSDENAQLLLGISCAHLGDSECTKAAYRALRSARSPLALQLPEYLQHAGLSIPLE